MEIPDKAYLTALMEEAMKKSYDFKYVSVDENKLDITYIATKKRNHLGLQEGLSAQNEMKTYQVKEVSSVRSNCRFYNKFLKANGRLHKVEAYVDGHDRLSTTYYAYYEGNKRYLFEYIGYDAATKKNAVTIYVSVYDGDQVIEAYTVRGSHIIYEKYDYTKSSQVNYYCISYVPSGKYPVLGEYKGYFDPVTLDYTETYRDTWYDREQKDQNAVKDDASDTESKKETPALQISDRGQLYTPEKVKKLKAKVKKYKKRALLFCKDHYYAINKNSLQRYDIPDEGAAVLQAETKVSKDTYVLAASDSERYLVGMTFSHALTVVDMVENKVIAKKKAGSNGGSYDFAFVGDDRLLYFIDNQIFSWDFRENKALLIWAAPSHMEFICRNVVADRLDGSVVFYCLANGKTESIPEAGTYVITVKGNTLTGMKKLGEKDRFDSKLVYSEALNCYSLFIDDRIRIYDEQFNVLEEMEAPYFVRRESLVCKPEKVYLSPDGKWLLLAYRSSYVILMDRKSKEVKCCLCDKDISSYVAVGFVNERQFCYTKGDSTFIQDFGEICEIL